MKIPTIVFKAKNKENRYLCNGPDCGDWSDEFLDTQEITDALHIIKTDFKKPTEEMYKTFISSWKAFHLIMMWNLLRNTMIRLIWK
ncbi:hypothetical protein [Bacillus toyonensis]|uniref:hypothetical protein n=1 Tax=Bacillus toyonensis TaxID=155322 RepID=UPI00211D5745|nr:hypothetical protein [Bacillus toyonensis]